MPKHERMPIHSKMFLPARRTDLIAVRDLDLDALHRQLWSQRDARQHNAVARPTVNNYVVAMLIAQGRMRRFGGICYVKDPTIWEDEVVDLRELPVPPGRWRCQFCGRDFERPVRPNVLIACWQCSELIGLRSYFTEDLWDEFRDLKVRSSQAS
jgi:hypothetical protein